MVQPHVGTLREKPLHADLKLWASEPGDLFEQPVDGFVIDVVRGDLLIEIQTRGFSSMKRKLHALLETHHVRVIHPVAVERHIIKLEDTGEILSRRKSPKRGRTVDVFSELVSFPELIAHERFSLVVVLTTEEEIRMHEPGKAWRRQGWVIQERRLVEVRDHVELSTLEAVSALLPVDLPAEFTTADLSAGVKRPRRLAQQMAYCLVRAGAIQQVDKAGNAIVYARV